MKEGEGKNYKLFDLGWLTKFLNISVDRPNIVSGVIKGNLRYRNQETGLMYF